MTELSNYNVEDCTCGVDHNSLNHIFAILALEPFKHPLVQMGVLGAPDYRSAGITASLPEFAEVLIGGARAVGWQGEDSAVLPALQQIWTDTEWPQVFENSDPDGVFDATLAALEVAGPKFEAALVAEGWKLVRE